MSLINKMLRDLDARGAHNGQPAPDAVHPVAPRERGSKVLIVVLGTAVVVGAMGAMLIGYRLMGVTPAPAAPAVLAATAPAAVPAPVSPSAPAPAPVTQPADLAAAKPAVAPLAASGAPQAAAAPAPASPSGPANPATAGSVRSAETPPAAAPVRPEPPAPAGSPAAPSQRQAKQLAPVAPPAALAAMRAEAMEEGARTPGRGLPTRARAGTAAAAADTPAVTVATPGSREQSTQLTTQQRAENQYRRALDALEEGRTTEALERLQQALEIEPRHQAARETLVRLLLESNRADDAVRQLQLALERDAAQPAMAMMLARLQLEKAGTAAPALATLMRSLPSAAGNAEYLAFLAAVLQREQRYADSSGYYRQALRLAPQNSVWWMGLGISLQGDGHAADAGEAYSRAKASGNLTPELQAFVDRKIQQIGLQPGR
jgi:MSHA biogenesis protein MshN